MGNGALAIGPKQPRPSSTLLDPKRPFGLASDLTAHLGVPIPITGGVLADEAMQLFRKRARTFAERPRQAVT
jgi:hypothetical protein